MDNHNKLGIQGENTACNFLICNGYRIVRRNWRHGRIEIDIIAQKDEYIIFVEVKTRFSDRWGNTEDAVTNAKMKRIVEAADFYIRDNDIAMDARFDIIAAVWNGSGFEIDHIEDAFYAPVN